MRLVLLCGPHPSEFLGKGGGVPKPEVCISPFGEMDEFPRIRNALASRLQRSNVFGSYQRPNIALVPARTLFRLDSFGDELGNELSLGGTFARPEASQ